MSCFMAKIAFTFLGWAVVPFVHRATTEEALFLLSLLENTHHLCRGWFGIITGRGRSSKRADVV